jgi:hypothetical protein
MADDLDGLNLEQLRERAKELQQQNDTLAAKQLYGDAATGGGEPGSAGRARNSDDDAAFVQDFSRRFNSKTGRHQAGEPVTTAEVTKYVRILTGAHLTQQLAENSQSFRRAGLTSDVVRAARERR